MRYFRRALPLLSITAALMLVTLSVPAQVIFTPTSPTTVVGIPVGGGPSIICTDVGGGVVYCQ